MLQFLGGMLMMAGGGMVSAFGFVIARAPVREPIGAVGEALDHAFPSDTAALPADMAALLDQLP